MGTTGWGSSWQSGVMQLMAGLPLVVDSYCLTTRGAAPLLYTEGLHTHWGKQGTDPTSLEENPMPDLSLYFQYIVYFRFLGSVLFSGLE